MLHLNPRCDLSEIFDYTFGDKCDRTEKCMSKNVRDLFMIVCAVTDAWPDGGDHPGSGL